MRLEIDAEFVLRSPEHVDADALFMVIDGHRDHLGRFLDWVDETRSVADVHDYVARAQEGERAGTELTFLVERVSTRELCGSVGLDGLNREAASAELGYWLREDLQGQGLATRAAQCLIDHAFDQMGLRHLTLRAAPVNTRSCALAQRLGFRRNESAGDEARPERRVLYSLSRESAGACC